MSSRRSPVTVRGTLRAAVSRNSVTPGRSPIVPVLVIAADDEFAWTSCLTLENSAGKRKGPRAGLGGRGRQLIGERADGHERDGDD